MATEFKVFYNVREAGWSQPPVKEVSKTAAEELKTPPFGITTTEAITVYGPAMEGKFITIEASSAEVAALYADRVLKLPVTGAFSKEKEYKVGTVPKSTPTVKSTEWKEETSI